MLTLAVALAGITVFAPAAMNPPTMPCTSSVGRAHTRSSTVNPGSPVSCVEPTSTLRNSFSSNGSVDQECFSAGVGGATSS